MNKNRKPSNDLGSSSDRAMMTGRGSEAREMREEDAAAEGSRQGTNSERGRGSAGERNLGSERDRQTPGDRGVGNREAPDPLPERES